MIWSNYANDHQSTASLLSTLHELSLTLDTMWILDLQLVYLVCVWHCKKFSFCVFPEENWQPSWLSDYIRIRGLQLNIKPTNLIKVIMEQKISPRKIGRNLIFWWLIFTAEIWYIFKLRKFSDFSSKAWWLGSSCQY